MLNTANYWRNVDQNYNEVSSHTGQNGHGLLLCRHKSLQITNARERCGEKEILLYYQWEFKLVQKASMEVLQNT